MRLEPGMAAPRFRLPNDTGGHTSLDDYAGEPLVIYFYPKAFTPGCTTEACDFRDGYAALTAAGYAVVGISPDPIDRLARFRAEYDLPFPLLSDEDHATATAYGAWGTKKNYGKEYEGLIRSTFLLDASGNIERAWYNVRAKGHAARVAREAVE
jgi:peroxiredoxin Q/BCP